MDFRIPAPAYAIRIGWRFLLATVLGVLFIYVLANTQYYATALVLVAIVALTLLDMIRLSRRPDVLASSSLRAQMHDQARELDRMAALLDAVTVALIAVDAGGKITFTNRAARKLAREEIVHLEDITGLGRNQAEILLAMPNGARQILTLMDGSNVLAWSGSFGAPRSTDQKLFSLQTVIGELDAVQLRAWQDMTRVLSHEIMNSLTPISSLSESLPGLLLRSPGDFDKDVMVAVETIARRSQHLMNFVERYRRIAALPEPDYRDIGLTQFIADLDGLMHPLCASKGISYGSVVSSQDLVIQGDPELLSQAVINLLHNAVDAAENMERPVVKLFATRSDSEIQFSVSDNGSGIPPELLDEIHVPFFTTKKNGSGIGLTLARQIVLAHRGQLEPLPNPDGGMTFRIVIPDRR